MMDHNAVLGNLVKKCFFNTVKPLLEDALLLNKFSDFGAHFYSRGDNTVQHTIVNLWHVLGNFNHVKKPSKS